MKKLVYLQARCDGLGWDGMGPADSGQACSTIVHVEMIEGKPVIGSRAEKTE